MIQYVMIGLIILILYTSISFAIIFLIAWRRGKNKELDPFTQQTMEQISKLQEMGNNLMFCLNALDQKMSAVPVQVLRSIQGDLNHLKGTVAEHISYLQLNAAYDRLLPFNSITDFIGIKFPHGDDPGRLDFIDIKSGGARVSREQSSLRRIIDGKHINFVIIKVITDQPQFNEDQACEPT